VAQLATGVSRLLRHEESPEEELDRLRRLEAVERLLPAFFQVLDVREIFDRVSAITGDVVPHEFASVGVFNDELTEVTIGPREYTGPMPYPPSQTSAWLCRFLKDLLAHPIDRDRDSAANQGARSSIRIAIRLGGTVIGALNYSSRRPSCYGALDLTIGRRVADYVALAMSHQRLAEEGRRAAGGTLFLDEVGEMSLTAQAKLLRVLEVREFQRLGGTRVLRSDARLVAATNLDLERAIQQGKFREDLFFRLHVFAIPLPALRDRPDDIAILSDAFLAEFAQQFGRPPAGISIAARRMLMSHWWPGNVRELRNCLERAAILCEGGLIAPEHLWFTGRARPAGSGPSATAAPSPPAQDLGSVEKTMIEQALAAARFNKSQAARGLGLSRPQLYSRMRKHGLT
jgi:transcriptional regulator with GAF, ATPase, and Fis domain